MNYIRHLSAFFFRHTKRDTRLNANHISLYLALFQYWNLNRFQNPFPITRDEVMAISGIGSKNTYHKCLKELHQYGYIYYRASLSKFQKSNIHIVKLDTENAGKELQQLDLFGIKNEPPTLPNTVQVKASPSINFDTVPVSNLTGMCPKIKTVSVPYLGLLIKHKHTNNKKEVDAQARTQKIFSKNHLLQKCINAFGVVPYSIHSAPPLQVAHSPNPPAGNAIGSCPTFSDVLGFFNQHQYPAVEAHKFFHHYQSNGWLVAGKTPMQHWPASAHKWMLNTNNFKNNLSSKNVHAQQNNFDTASDKNYAQPL